MDESSALVVTAARALESADSAHAVWSDADRAWASRAAALIVGEGAPAETFIARRAALVLERVGERHKALPRAVDAVRWRPWVGYAVVALAFLAGIVVDDIGGTKRINILAPPALALIVWNLTVYVIFVAGYVVRYGDRAELGPLRRLLVRIAGGAVKSRTHAMAGVTGAFAVEWARRSAPLHGVRAARILHLAAAALALGVIAGFYLRGIAFDYRASWESTFLSPPTVHTFVSIAYAPGVAVAGIAVPTVDEIAAIRAPASENAGRWLHLIAATLVVLVVVPRFALALVAGLTERHRARHVHIGLNEPYFQRLLRGFRGGPAHVCVLPYTYSPPPACVSGLEAIVARGFGSGTSVLLSAPIPYGSDEPLPEAGDKTVTTIALFNATATPERDVHGAFLGAVRARGGALVAMVDVSALVARYPADPAAIEPRLAAWRELADEARVPLVVANLVAPDLNAADAALDVALGTAPAGAPTTTTPSRRL